MVRDFNTKKVRLKLAVLDAVHESEPHFNTKKVRLKLPGAEELELKEVKDFNTKKVRLKQTSPY